MGINKQVFGSKAERQIYYKLSRQWGNKYHIYHNLPFLNVFNTSSLFVPSDKSKQKKLQLGEFDFNRLKKTSIDFTLCDENDTPLICIEYDGLQEGFNVGTSYHSTMPSDEWRYTIMELKLAVAHGSDFPFFIVGSKEFANICDSIKLTIVDGIIGEVLTNKTIDGLFSSEIFAPEDFGLIPDEFDSLPKSERQEIIDRWAIRIEGKARYENNPIFQKVVELHNIIGYPTLSGGYEAIAQNVSYPARRFTYRFSPANLEVEIVFPNFKTPYFVDMLMLEAMARLIILERLRVMKWKVKI